METPGDGVAMFDSTDPVRSLLGDDFDKLCIPIYDIGPNTLPRVAKRLDYLQSLIDADSKSPAVMWVWAVNTFGVTHARILEYSKQVVADLLISGKYTFGEERVRYFQTSGVA